MSLKFTGVFRVMKAKNDAKCEGELTCQFDGRKDVCKIRMKTDF